MADEQTTDKTQAVEPSQPQAGEPQTAAAAQAADKPALDADALRKELEDARKEAAKYRTERKSANDTLAQLQKELEAIRQAQMTDEQKKQAEFEKAQQEAAQLRQELDTERKARQELALKTIVQAAAGKLGVVDPDAAFVLLRTMTPLEPGPDGWDTKAVTEAVQKLVKDKPYLLGASTASPANPARQAANDTGESDEQRRARLYGAGANIFNPSFGKSKGGGVIWPDGKEPRS